MPKSPKRKPKESPTTSDGSNRTPLQCNVCGNIGRDGPLCKTCPLYSTHHYSEGIGEGPADFFCVAESPYLSGSSKLGVVGSHASWTFHEEKMIRKTFEAVKNDYRDLSNLNGHYTFAVRCDKDKTNKKARTSCYPLLLDTLLKNAKPNRPLMIFALGKAVLQSLNLKVSKYSECQGKFIETSIEGRRILVYPSFSKRQLLTKTGYLDVLKQHVHYFLYAVDGLNHNRPIETELPLEELTRNYVFPKTLEEVRKLVELIVNYAKEGTNPDCNSISLDTETNTLFPHRDRLKILSLVVSWAPGYAASIPIEHPETPWTFEDVHPYIAQILSCAKPKIFHNAKFDLKVLYRKNWHVRNVVWDTMLGEHLIAEDKRGFYGLKDLTKLYLPQYAGYEDQLHTILETLEAQENAEKPTKLNSTILKGAAKKLAQDKGFEHIPLNTLNVYGAIDADVTRQLCENQRQRIDDENNKLTKLRARYRDNPHVQHLMTANSGKRDPTSAMMFHRAIPASNVLAHMELHGMAVDREYADDLALEMDGSITEQKIELYKMIPPKAFGDPFNANSTQQVQKVLFGTGFYHPETRELISYKGVIPEEEIRRTDTGMISTDAHFLRLLATQYDCPFSRTLLKYRAVYKARTTFIENIRALSQEDGRMHTNFNIPGTATGRLSSSGENMQNIPLWIGKHNIKKLFIPTDPETLMIVNADAKAAEVRLYAAYSGDKNLIDALLADLDPHSFFASTVYKPETVLANVRLSDRQRVLQTIGIDDQHDWSYEDFQNRERITNVDPDYGKRLEKLRKNIKRVVFGILYGASKNKISAIVGIPKEQAQAIINVLFRMFPTIEKYIQSTKDQVNILNVVETFIGRRRRFDIRSMTKYLKAKAERQAVNFKIQSTSSDIVLDVLCSLYEPLKEIKSQLLITVHDSVVFQTPKKYLSQVPDIMEQYGVKQVAKHYPWLPVPFKWDVEVGPSYGELQSIKSYLEEHSHVAYMQPKDDMDYLEHEIKQDLSNIA